MPQQSLHGLKERFRLEQHSFAAAKRPIIHRAMTIVCKLAHIAYVHFHETGLASAAHDPVVERTGEKFRKNSDDIKAHIGAPFYAGSRHTAALGLLSRCSKERGLFVAKRFDGIEA